MAEKTKAWELAERKANDLIGLSGTRGSGNQHDDGDGTNSLFVHEVKQRGTFDNHIVPGKQWNKLCLQAASRNKIPIFTTVRLTARTAQVDRPFVEEEMLTTMRTEDISRFLNEPVSPNKDRLCDAICAILDPPAGRTFTRQELTIATGKIMDLIKQE